MSTQLHDVFGLSNRITRSYVNRGGLDDHFRYLLHTDRHIVIHGDSKQGKSWLRSEVLGHDHILVQCQVISSPSSLFKEALATLGIRAEIKRTSGRDLEGTLSFSASGSLGAAIISKLGLSFGGSGRDKRSRAVESEPIGHTPADLAWVAKILNASDKRLVIEDFHYVSDKSRQQFAFMLKALGEYGVHPIIVGVWPDDHLLTYYNGDLEGRVEDIHLRWKPEELELVLTTGSKALNIVMSPTLRSALVQDAYGNVGLLQRLAEQICREEGIVERQPSARYLIPGPTLERARTAVADQMRSRFEGFADSLLGGSSTPRGGLSAYTRLLRIVCRCADGELSEGIHSSRLVERGTGDASSVLHGISLDKALRQLRPLQERIGVSPPLLSYQRHSNNLFLVDRSFLFFRRYGEPRWPWEDDEIAPS